MKQQLPKHDIVLLGIGHTNAHVLRMWKMHPIRDARLTCISDFTIATYSGMVPGVLAGQYPRNRMEIDLARLCAAAGARLIVDQVTGINLPDRQLLFETRPPVIFDALSIGIGSIPNCDDVILKSDNCLTIKPMQTLIERLDKRLKDLKDSISQRALHIAIVGGGAGGVEVALCLPARIRRLLGKQPFELMLVNSHKEIVKDVIPATRRRLLKQLENRGVQLELGHRVTQVTNDQLSLDDGRSFPADLVLWATSATASPLLSQLQLPTDDRGFLLTKPTLQSTAHDRVFAVGDTGTIKSFPTVKSGVYAVRQGEYLWRNLEHLLLNQPLENYRPQSSFLKLFNTGDGRAIGEYKAMSFVGAWCWKLKNRIDSRFMDKYQDYAPMEMPPAENDPVAEMRCAGCGGKVGGSVLSRVLKRLDVPSHPDVLLGLEAPDDAAVLKSPAGRAWTVTADFFAAPLDDPYLVGRISTLNAASDVFALGARPIAGLALVTIPEGRPRHQEQLLYELLAGSLEELRRMGATLVGGHTIEGPQLTMGLTMLADQGTESPRTKGRLQVGDHLILSKPIGSGVLLAGNMRALCRAPWREALLDCMLAGNEIAAPLIESCDIQALTDVTGFGLAGHLLEMLRSSQVSAHVELRRIPYLPGAEDLVEQGIESTLAPANRDVEPEIIASQHVRQSSRYSLLFDPQTGGPLLMGVSSSNVDMIIKRLAELGLDAAEIGQIKPVDNRGPTLYLE